MLKTQPFSLLPLLLLLLILTWEILSYTATHPEFSRITNYYVYVPTLQHTARWFWSNSMTEIHLWYRLTDTWLIFHSRLTILCAHCSYCCKAFLWSGYYIGVNIDRPELLYHVSMFQCGRTVDALLTSQTFLLFVRLKIKCSRFLLMAQILCLIITMEFSKMAYIRSQIFFRHLYHMLSILRVIVTLAVR